jgi:hypothetical protein
MARERGNLAGKASAPGCVAQIEPVQIEPAQIRLTQDGLAKDQELRV